MHTRRCIIYDILYDNRGVRDCPGVFADVSLNCVCNVVIVTNN